MATLFTPKHELNIRKAGYQNTYEITGYAGSFYLLDTAIKKLPTLPSEPEKFCIEQAKDEAEFDQFFEEWLTDSAVLYRGLPGCHFCWPKLRKEGRLLSEGKADLPTFTMGNTTPTRWLPSAVQEDTAAGIGLSCLDEYTKRDLKTEDVPVGIVVKIPVGRNKALPLSWLNPGETVVQGPLGVKQFQICGVVWLLAGDYFYMRIDIAFNELFPQRPYEPKSKQAILDWFKLLKGTQWEMGRL